MSQAQRVEPAPLSAAELLAEVARLYQELQALPWNSSSEKTRRVSPAYQTIEAQIRAYSERYWAFETVAGRPPVIGILGGRRRPYLVLAK